MANNEPLYALIKAHQMKMYRAVYEKRKFQKLVDHFDYIASLEKMKIVECSNVILMNRTDCFASFWRLLE